jgi:hypothetical protein
MTTGRRGLLAVLVTVVVAFGSAPTPALADEGGPFDPGAATVVGYDAVARGEVVVLPDENRARYALFAFAGRGEAATVAATNRGSKSVGVAVYDDSLARLVPDEEDGERGLADVPAGGTTRITVPVEDGSTYYALVTGIVDVRYDSPRTSVPVEALVTEHVPAADPTEPNDDPVPATYGSTTAASLADGLDDDRFALAAAGGRTRLAVTNLGDDPLGVSVERFVAEDEPHAVVVGARTDGGYVGLERVAPGATRTFTFPTAGETHLVGFGARAAVDYEFRLDLLDNDRLEPNDRLSQAGTLAPGRYEGLLLPEGDGDLYGVPLSAGDGVVAAVSLESDAAVGVGLFESVPDGTDRLLADGRLVDGAVTLGYTAVDAPADRTYLFVAADGATGYVLDLSYGPSPVPPDRFEPNDDGNASLATLPVGTTDGLTLTPGDDDPFRLELVAGTEVTVRLRTTGGDVVPTLLVADTAGTPVGDADAVAGVAAVTVPVTATGTHFVSVSDRDPTRTGTYLLEVEPTPGTAPDRPGDDRFEPNDVADGVTPLPPGTYPGLSVAGADVDAFLVDVAAGELFVAGAAFAPDATAPTVLTLLDLDGTPVQQSRGRGSVSLSFDAAAAGAPGGQYVLVVDPADDPPGAPVEKPYTLSTATYPGSPDDDRFEPNDGTGPDDVTVLGPGVETGLVAGPFANDFYAVEAAPGANVTLSVDYDPTGGALSVVRLAPNGSVVGGPVPDGTGAVTATVDGSGRALFVVGGAAGTVEFVTYELRVTVADDGDGAGNDRFEPNDDAGAETSLDPGTYPDLRVTGADVDGFALELAPGDLLTATANFSVADADLDLLLFAPDGSLVTLAVSGTDDERLYYLVPPDAGGRYVLLVEAFLGAGDAAYALTVDVGPSPLPADRFEPNDAGETPLLPGTYADLTLTPGDVDPYAVNVSTGETLRVALRFVHADADLDAFVYGPTGSLVAESLSETDDETLSVVADATGTHLVVVEAADPPSAAAYALEIRVDGGDGGTGDGDGGTDDGDGDVPTPDPPFDGPVPGVAGAAPPADHDGDGLYEDVNGDGSADLDDAFDLAFALADLGSLTLEQTAALDFDADGDVDLDDAFALAFR